MKLIRKILKWLIIILLIPISYLIVSLILTFIPVNDKKQVGEKNKEVYLSTNRVHLNIIIQKSDLDSAFLKDLHYHDIDKYFSFGWGEENFYLNTPTWGDLTFKNALSALLVKSSTLVHLSRYTEKKQSWIKINLSEIKLKNLNQYVLHTFQLDSSGRKIILNNQGYSANDDFYKATGNYSCFNTCNSWVNSGLKESNLKACYWTPFDFGILMRYKE